MERDMGELPARDRIVVAIASLERGTDATVVADYLRSVLLDIDRATPSAAPEGLSRKKLTTAIDDALSAVDDEWTTDELAELILARLVESKT